jgi:hypothetical protein
MLQTCTFAVQRSATFVSREEHLNATTDAGLPYSLEVADQF